MLVSSTKKKKIKIDVKIRGGYERKLIASWNLKKLRINIHYQEKDNTVQWKVS